MILTNVVATKAVDDLIKANSDFSLEAMPLNRYIRAKM